MTDVDLLGLARRVAGDARAGEQVEAYALRSRDVDVKVFGGEVESLAVAEIEGVGVRVIVDARQGYAWAGSLDPDVVAETVAEARDNAAFGSPDEHYALAGARRLRHRRRARARPLARRRARDPDLREGGAGARARSRDEGRRPRVCGASSRRRTAMPRSRARSRTRWVSRRARAARSRRARPSPWRARAPPPRRGAASRPGARSPISTRRRPRATPPQRAVRLLGAQQIRSARLPVVLDPLVTRSVLALLGGALSGEAIVKGRSLFVGREGEEVAGPAITLVDDPTLRRGLRCGHPRRRGRTHPAARADRRWPTRRVPAQRLHRAPRRCGHDGIGRPRRVQVAPGGRGPRPAPPPGHARRRRRSWRRCPKRSTCSR